MAFLLFIVLLTLPAFYNIYYREVYYFVIVSLAIAFIVSEVKGFNTKEGRIKRWHLKKEQGFKRFFIMQSTLNVMRVIFIVLFGQLIINGVTFSMIIDRVKLPVLLFLAFLIGATSMLSAWIYWNENTKKYK